MEFQVYAQTSRVELRRVEPGRLSSLMVTVGMYWETSTIRGEIDRDRSGLRVLQKLEISLYVCILMTKSLKSAPQSVQCRRLCSGFRSSSWPTRLDSARLAPKYWNFCWYIYSCLYLGARWNERATNKPLLFLCLNLHWLDFKCSASNDITENREEVCCFSLSRFFVTCALSRSVLLDSFCMPEKENSKRTERKREKTNILPKEKVRWVTILTVIVQRKPASGGAPVLTIFRNTSRTRQVAVFYRSFPQ